MGLEQSLRKYIIKCSFMKHMYKLHCLKFLECSHKVASNYFNFSSKKDRNSHATLMFSLDKGGNYSFNVYSHSVQQLAPLIDINR